MLGLFTIIFINFYEIYSIKVFRCYSFLCAAKPCHHGPQSKREMSVNWGAHVSDYLPSQLE
jgi:hypothetical protein